jgi:hypothetical protein
MISQILAGGAVSFVNFAIHALMTGLIVVATRQTAALTEHLNVFWRLTSLLTIAVTALMVAHLIEVWVWMLFYTAVGVAALTQVHPFEFAFENYTALGYGDAVPVPGMRLYAPLTALNGLLLIGWSVAIIFEVMRMAEVQIGHRRKRRAR